LLQISICSLGSNPALTLPTANLFIPIAKYRQRANMSGGDVKPPTNPVVAEAHEVDTFREYRNDEGNSSMLTSSRSPKKMFLSKPHLEFREFRKLLSGKGENNGKLTLLQNILASLI